MYPVCCSFRFRLKQLREMEFGGPFFFYHMLSELIVPTLFPVMFGFCCTSVYNLVVGLTGMNIPTTKFKGKKCEKQ